MGNNRAVKVVSVWEELGKAWPPYMSVKMVKGVSGGIIAAQTLYNYTSQGKGIRDGRKCGRTILYPKQAVIDFLMEFCGEKQREEV